MTRLLRPPSASKRADLLVASVILLLAALLRITGLGYGQPDPAYAPEDIALNTIHENTPIHPDEFLFVQRPLRMLLTGQLNPKFFHNPSFLINTNLVVYWLTGEQHRLSWDGREEIGARRAAPFRLYLNGRLFSALGGMLAVATTFAAARLLTGRYGAAAAALVVTASVPMVQHAHYTTTSSLAAGFVMLCVWACLSVLHRFNGWLFALAGVAAGLAAGCRYNAAAVSLVVFVTGLVILYKERRMLGFTCVILGYMLFPAVFLLTTPHIIFDTAFVWAEFQAITNQYIGGERHLLTVSKWVGLRYELTYLALFGLGVPAAVAALLGMWRGLRDAPTRVPTLALLAYLLPYTYVVLRTIRPLGADQMLLPIIPPLALFAGVGVGWLWRQLPRRGVLVGALLLVVLIAYPLAASVQVVGQFATTDTRHAAQAWAHEHIPHGSTVHLLGPYNVPLDNTLYTWNQTYGGSDIPNVDVLRAQGVQYVIASDAWRWQLARSGFFSAQELATLPEAQSIAGQDGVIELLTVPRPVLLGTAQPLHSATYWHHPQITISCITADACAATR